jgi:hypothetical protein
MQQQTTQTLLADLPAKKTLWRFSVVLSLLLAGVIALFNVPMLQNLLLQRLYKLDGHVLALASQGLLLVWMLPLLDVMRGYLIGINLFLFRSGWVGIASAVRVLVLIAAIPAAQFFGSASPMIVALAIWIAALCCENIALWLPLLMRKSAWNSCKPDEKSA